MKILITILTILICFGELNAQSPYKISWGKESIVFGAGIASAFISSSIDDSVVELTESEIQLLNIMDVNAFDRSATNHYSQSAARISDAFLIASASSPFLLLADKEIKSDFGIITVMYLETMMHAVFIPSYGKGSVQRVRPFVYNENAPLDEKLTSEAKRSFFSGHATWAFSTSVFFASVYSKYNPDSKLKKIVWAGALTSAGIVGAMRYRSGAHFPTDILVGAGIGSLIGYIIPKFHEVKNESNLSITPIISSNSGSRSLNLNF